MTKIKYWDAERLTTKDSWYDYEVAYLVEQGEPSDDYVNSQKTIYLHEDSGIMVHDVAAFENWLFAVFRP